MGVVTWKNIAPSNPAGILSAANQAAQTMGEGFSGVGTALQGGVDKKVQSETDDFISDLMSLETQAERDAMIAEAEGGWLNLDTINKTNYELGAPQREMDMFNEQLASQTLVDQDAARLLAENQIKLQKEKNLTSSRTTPTSGVGSSGFGKDPFRSNGIYDSTLGTTNDTQWWMGAGMTHKDKTFLNKQKSDFLSLTRIQNLGITDEMFNELSNDSTITFDDGGFWEGGDSFNFTHEGKTYNIGHTNGWEDAISEVAQNKFLKTQSTRQVDRTNYFDVFTKNNPKYVEEHGLEGAKDKFMSIYKKHGVGSRKAYSDDLATEIFGIMSDTESSSSSSSSSSNNNTETTELVWDGTNFVDPPEKPVERTDNLAQINRVLSEAVKEVGGPIENELKGMSRPELQKLYDTLYTRQKNLEKIGQVLKGDELDLFNATTKALGS